jgi:L-iditol 2-dehydrogenase
MLIQLLLAGGASPVLAADPLPHRSQAAARFGARPAGNEPGGHGAADVDTAFEMAGTDDAVDAAMAAVRPGGRVVLAGIPGGDRTSFRASVARRKGLTIAMSRRMNEAYPRAIALAGSGRVALGPLVTHTAPLADVAGAFRLAARRDGLKVVVRPGG